MGRELYFGTREQMRFVRMFDANPEFNFNPWGEVSTGLNGGAWVDRSIGAHKSYQVSWNIAKRGELRPIIDYLQGLYGTGSLHFIDPSIEEENLLPSYWAAPFMGGIDGPVLLGTKRPTLTATPANNLGYPTQSATYKLNETNGARIWIPRPPDRALWIGVHGTSDGVGGVRVRPTLAGGGYGPASFPAMLAVTDRRRVTNSYSQSIYTGIEIDLAPGRDQGLLPDEDLYPGVEVYPQEYGEAGTTVTIAGIMVQALPLGQTPEEGGFFSGRGHSGLLPDPKSIRHQVYSAYHGQEGLSVKFVETEAWA